MRARSPGRRSSSGPAPISLRCHPEASAPDSIRCPSLSSYLFAIPSFDPVDQSRLTRHLTNRALRRSQFRAGRLVLKAVVVFANDLAKLFLQRSMRRQQSVAQRLEDLGIRSSRKRLVDMHDAESVGHRIPVTKRVVSQLLEQMTDDQGRLFGLHGAQRANAVWNERSWPTRAAQLRAQVSDTRAARVLPF